VISFVQVDTSSGPVLVCPGCGNVVGWAAEFQAAHQQHHEEMSRLADSADITRRAAAGASA
jgi:hypothetical protein